ncbi:MAG: GTP pyrophosphokinase family protein [Firmicutes bacterium]|nr:GTP pyrophosphokinase family protein [Bacillota bacterium]
MEAKTSAVLIQPGETSEFSDPEQMQDLCKAMNRFLLCYNLGMDQVNTKINTLKQEFQHIHEYNPIEHVKWRLKTPESILKKVRRRGCPWSFAAIRENVRDIAGIRITCSFVSDIYRVAGMLMQQPDLEVVEYKDYIEQPKYNGYRSLHIILKVPVYMSDHTERVYVEVQIRTIAMDFWASLEHKIYYKFQDGQDIPHSLHADLKEAAEAMTILDEKMERIHKEMQQLRLAGWNDDKPLLSADLSRLLINAQYPSV